MIDILPIAFVGAGMWIIGIVCGIAIADYVISAFETVADLFGNRK